MKWVTVAERADAVPLAVPGVARGHHGGLCSRDAGRRQDHLAAPALHEPALSAPGLDTEVQDCMPAARGWAALAAAFRPVCDGGHARPVAALPRDAARYDVCRTRAGGRT
jgi:hypothetical protein